MHFLVFNLFTRAPSWWQISGMSWSVLPCRMEFWYLKKGSDFHTNPIHPSAYIFRAFSIWEMVCVIFKLLLVAGYGQYAWSDKLTILSLVGNSVTQSRNQFALEKFLLQEFKMFYWNWNGRRIQNVWSDRIREVAGSLTVTGWWS